MRLELSPNLMNRQAVATVRIPVSRQTLIGPVGRCMHLPSARRMPPVFQRADPWVSGLADEPASASKRAEILKTARVFKTLSADMGQEVLISLATSWPKRRL